MNHLLNTIWFLLLVLIAVGSLMPVHGVPSFQHMDKCIHFAGYAFMAFIPAYFSGKWRIILKTGVILLLAGVAIEIAQYFVPSRDMSFYDFLANIAGICFGAISGRFIGRIFARRRK